MVSIIVAVYFVLVANYCFTCQIVTMSYEEKLGLAYFIDLGTKCNMEGSALSGPRKKKRRPRKN